MEEKKKTTQEKIVELRAKQDTTCGWIGAIGFAIILVGFALVIVGATFVNVYESLADDEYLTDDGLPYRDMNNASYTYPVSELNDKEEDYGLWIGSGIAIFAVGLASVMGAIYIMPSNIESHRIYCDGSGEKKYCPECGLKLSRLEKE